MTAPALLVAGTASGQGKTTVTAALARAARRRGQRVRCFKVGPDFIDPMILAAASGEPVYPLDLWLVGEDECRQRLARAAREADLVLVEGVMGLYDGTPSAADLARRFNLPVLAVVDAGAMAQTFGALIQGLASYRDGVELAAVVANGVASERHRELLTESLDGRWPLATLPRRDELALPERHLGLHTAADIEDLEQRLDRLADAVSDLDLTRHARSLALDEEQEEPLLRRLAGKTIAVARDRAFCFIYQANLDLLAALGADVRFFSPLSDEPVPSADAVWLPGGYPELHGETLAGNQCSRDSLYRHIDAGGSVLGECGGLLYLMDELVDKAGRTHAMAGILPGRGVMQARLAGLGPQQLDIAGPDRAVLRGHTFHYSLVETELEPLFQASSPNGRPGEMMYRQGRVLGSYFHGYWPSAPDLLPDLLLNPDRL